MAYLHAPVESIRGHLCIGERGPESAPLPKDLQAKHLVVLACGNELLFSSAPTTGEFLYCTLHRKYETCRVIGGYVVGCNTCDYSTEGYGDNSSRAGQAAYRHRQKGHEATIGRYTKTGVEWRVY